MEEAVAVLLSFAGLAELIFDAQVLSEPSGGNACYSQAQLYSIEQIFEKR